MKKLFIIATMLAAAIAASAALSNKKVANANKKSIDEMLSYALTLQGPTTLNAGQFYAELYQQVGVDIPVSTDLQASSGKKIKKENKLEKGDIVFFNAGDGKNKENIATSAIVYKVNEKPTFNYDLIYVTNDNQVKISNSNEPGFKGSFIRGSHFVSDKELQKAQKAYATLVEKAKKQDEKVKNLEEKAKKAQSKAEEKDSKMKSAQNAVADAEKALESAAKEVNTNSEDIQNTSNNQSAKVAEKKTKQLQKSLQQKIKAEEKLTKAKDKEISATKDANNAKQDFEKIKNELKAEKSKAEDLHKALDAD